MNTALLSKIETKQVRRDLPNFKVGDLVAVDNIIREGDKKRIQVFQGLVMSIKGSGLRKMFTVRKISYGVGVEKVFPLNSTNISSIKVLKHGKGRRSKLYYLRDRIGKLALKVKPGRPAPFIEHAAEEVTEELIQEAVEAELSEQESDTQVEEVSAEQLAEEPAGEQEETPVSDTAEEATEPVEEKAPEETK